MVRAKSENKESCISPTQRVGLAVLALCAAHLAFHGFGFFIFLSPGLLALSVKELSTAKKILFTIVWGVLFAGLFHSWTFLDRWTHWLTLVVVRGVPWGVFCLPQLSLEKSGRRGPLQQALGTGLGLVLISGILLITPAGFDWETPMAALAAWPWCLTCLPWLGLLGGAFLIGLCSHLILCGHKYAMVLGTVILSLWAGLSFQLFQTRTQNLPPLDLNIALLQTGWSQGNKWDPKYRLTSKQRLFHMTKEAQEKGAKLVVWPETAWPVYGLRESERDANAVSRLAKELDVDILATSVELVAGGSHNSVSLVTPENGFEAVYHKRRLLPFSEYIPLLAPIDTLYVSLKPYKADRQFLPGTESVVFTSGGYSFTPLICFESMVPYTISRNTADKVDFIVVITNDAGLHRPFPREAHFRSAVLRAAQFRKPIVQAGNTGVSGVIDSHGVVLRRTQESLHGSSILTTSGLRL